MADFRVWIDLTKESDDEESDDEESDDKEEEFIFGLRWDEVIDWAEDPNLGVNIAHTQHGCGLFATKSFKPGDIVAKYNNGHYFWVRDVNPKYERYAFNMVSESGTPNSIVPRDGEQTFGLFVINEPFSGMSFSALIYERFRTMCQCCNYP
jgi:hypothetical protein